MSPEVNSLLLSLGILAAGFISIGPNILTIIGTSMERGRKDGVRLALGIAAGSGVWATLTVAGLTGLVSVYADAMAVLKILGAIYLCWLAYRAFRSAATPASDAINHSARSRNLFLQGMLIQLTNPKAALHWVAIVSFGLGTESPAWLGAALIFSATMVSVVGHVMYAVAFSTSPAIMFYQRFRRRIEVLLGAFFCFAAYKLVTFRD